MNKNDTDRFNQGFAAAMSALIKLYDLPTIAKNIMSSNGITLKDLQNSNCEKYDTDIIQKALQ